MQEEILSQGEPGDLPSTKPLEPEVISDQKQVNIVILDDESGIANVQTLKVKETESRRQESYQDRVKPRKKEQIYQ